MGISITHYNFVDEYNTLYSQGDNLLVVKLSSGSTSVTSVKTLEIKLCCAAFWPDDIYTDPIDTSYSPFYSDETILDTISVNYVVDEDKFVSYTWNYSEKLATRTSWCAAQFENYRIWYEVRAYNSADTEIGVLGYAPALKLIPDGFKVYGTNGIEVFPWVSEPSNSTNALTNDTATYIRYFTGVNAGLFHRYWEYKDGVATGTGEPYYYNRLTNNILSGRTKDNVVLNNNVFEWEYWGTQENQDTDAKETDHAYCTYTIPADKFVNYFPISCNVRVGTVSEDGTAEIEVYGVFFDDTFGSKGVANAIQSLELTYGLVSDSSSSNTIALDVSTLTVTDNNYSIKYTIGSLDFTKRYTFSATIADKATSATSSATHQSIIYGTPTFDWGKNDFRFNVPVNIDNGGLTIKSGNLTVNGKINFDATTNQYIPTYGSWTPEINMEYVVGTRSYQGNYVRIGDMCIINFYVAFEPLYQESATSKTLKISGLPFEPYAYTPWQSGGGTAHGYYVDADPENNVFSGWSIEKYTNTGVLDPDTTGWYIFGKCSEIVPGGIGSNENVSKKSYYLSANHLGDSVVMRLSGTIMYKIAGGQ